MCQVLFDNIKVSEIEVDFTKTSPEAAPRDFFEDWIKLICRIVRLFYPNFDLLPLPDTINFSDKTRKFVEYIGAFPDMVAPARDDFVWFEKEVGFFELKNADQKGVEIMYHSESEESGVKARGEVEVNLTGFPKLTADKNSFGLMSKIYSDSPKCRAEFFIVAPDKKMWEIQGVLRRF